MPLTVVITAVAAAVFVSCLLYRAWRAWQRPSAPCAGRHHLTRSRTGRHWRTPKQPPSPVLTYALKTVGTHGLGFIRDREAA